MLAQALRGWLGAALLCAAGPAAAAEAAAPRIAVLNWGLAQTVLGLGVEPVAVANTPGYRKWVAEPALPPATVDLGRRIEPNLDVLAGAEPSLILMSGYYRRPRERLETIAPTRKLSIYRPDGNALDRGLEVAAEIAGWLGREAALGRLRRDLERAIEGLAAAAEPGESVYVVQFEDAGHVRVFGGKGLHGGVLARAGLDNAWQGRTNYWGFALVPLARLDAAADHLVVIEPVPRPARRMMASSPIWQALPPVRSGRVHRLDPVWSFGGVPAAIRFADLLAEALRDDG